MTPEAMAETMAVIMVETMVAMSVGMIPLLGVALVGVVTLQALPAPDHLVVLGGQGEVGVATTVAVHMAFAVAPHCHWTTSMVDSAAGMITMTSAGTSSRRIPIGPATSLA